MPKQNKIIKDNLNGSAKSTDSHLLQINQEIYKRNLELSVVNKTLSLLKKLYQISLLTLDPASLSIKISEAVRNDLNMEVVGIYLFDEKADTLTPFRFAKSDRFKKAALGLNFNYDSEKVTDISNNLILKKILFEKEPDLTNNLDSLLLNKVPASKLNQTVKDSHLKTVLMYPLITGNTSIGILLFGLNREYSLLSGYEKESIQNLADVAAVALDKSLLYEQLKVANEELKVLDQARAEFISIASHQLRTPPATVKWYLSAALAGDYGKMNPEVAPVIEKAAQTNNHLISLIEDMLNVSRIERGKMEFLFELTDTEELAKFAYEQLIPQASNKKLKLTYTPPEYPLPKIMADKEKLRQVMNNLIDNAIKYTKQGQVGVTIFQFDDEICFAVKDNGKGIGQEDRKNIFQKYSRGKESIKQSAGLGLGLYVAKIIVEQHKGKIWAESDGEGKGSTFLFSIPIHNNLKQTTLIDFAKQ
jgi:signal transduction histidine kinase